jgi:hypothetical protein
MLITYLDLADSDGDGLPDYLADRNGDGEYDAIADGSLPLKVQITRPSPGSIVP